MTRFMLAYVVVVLSAGQVASDRQGAAGAQPAIDTQIARGIRAHAAGQAISDAVLRNDVQTLSDALEGELRKPLERLGVPAAKRAEAAAWIWALTRQDRKYTASTAVRVPDIVATAHAVGKLIIESSPKGGSVMVDNYRWPDPTDAVGYADEGRRAITVSRSGRDLKTTCDVSSGRVFSVNASFDTGQISCQQK